MLSELFDADEVATTEQSLGLRLVKTVLLLLQPDCFLFLLLQVALISQEPRLQLLVHAYHVGLRVYEQNRFSRLGRPLRQSLDRDRVNLLVCHL